WDDATYAVIVPLEKVVAIPENKISNFNVVDTFFVGDVVLPQGSTIIALPDMYDELIHEDIVSRDELMSKMGDDRYAATLLQDHIVEKADAKYIINNPLSTNLRQLVYHEIERAGYVPMPGGQWNWGHSGAEAADQRRIAEKLGAKHGIHHNSFLDQLEGVSSWLHDIATGKKRTYINAYVQRLQSGKQWSEEDLTYEEGQGLRILEDREMNGLIDTIEKMKLKLPLNFQQRVDSFLEYQKEKFKSLDVSVVEQRYRMAV
ncbi:MAG: hypothetical protein Q7K45_00760, partial [Nanoarchaeota archaeon]|nr:hypothetical protein [Nanoarchaeota archaeon]